jgi:hypothetical protein
MGKTGGKTAVTAEHGDKTAGTPKKPGARIYKRKLGKRGEQTYGKPRFSRTKTTPHPLAMRHG